MNQGSRPRARVLNIACFRSGVNQGSLLRLSDIKVCCVAQVGPGTESPHGASSFVSCPNQSRRASSLLSPPRTCDWSHHLPVRDATPNGTRDARLEAARHHASPLRAPTAPLPAWLRAGASRPVPEPARSKASRLSWPPSAGRPALHETVDAVSGAVEWRGCRRGGRIFLGAEEPASKFDLRYLDYPHRAKGRHRRPGSTFRRVHLREVLMPAALA